MGSGEGSLSSRMSYLAVSITQVVFPPDPVLTAVMGPKLF
jgi:hypothetical protein